jgi:hypothetical protein
MQAGRNEVSSHEARSTFGSSCSPPNSAKSSSVAMSQWETRRLSLPDPSPISFQLRIASVRLGGRTTSYRTAPVQGSCKHKACRLLSLPRSLKNFFFPFAPESLHFFSLLNTHIHALALPTRSLTLFRQSTQNIRITPLLLSFIHSALEQELPPPEHLLHPLIPSSAHKFAKSFHRCLHTPWITCSTPTLG